MSETRVVVWLGSLRAAARNRRIAETCVTRPPPGREIAISESAAERGDILAEPELVSRLLGALDHLVAHRMESADAA